MVVVTSAGFVANRISKMLRTIPEPTIGTCQSSIFGDKLIGLEITLDILPAQANPQMAQ
jgi:hypothetical protein